MLHERDELVEAGVEGCLGGMVDGEGGDEAGFEGAGGVAVVVEGGGLTERLARWEEGGVGAAWESWFF